jgi:hypothetical protein
MPSLALPKWKETDAQLFMTLYVTFILFLRISGPREQKARLAV